jgi:MinD superfamily P-loop ATPase
MKEILVLSGKGGTGKTSIVGSLAHLSDSKVMLDCDVDASDLHLLLSPKIVEKHEFRSGVKARVETDKCTACGMCAELCQFESVTMEESAVVSKLSCEGCGVCAHFCPEDAIRLDENHCGTWYISDTAFGPFVHSQLFAGEENSGKLVSHIKSEARKVAEQTGAELILIDGSPGVGCPVIASLSNVDMVLVVTEPSQSGKHDLERILDLTEHFKIITKLCINKWDLHSELSDEIELLAASRNVEVLGKIPFDSTVIDCQIQGIPVTASKTSLAAYSIKDLWQKLQKCIDGLPKKKAISLP